MNRKPLLRVEHLHVVYPGPSPVYAVVDASFDIMTAEIVALVGESGCGKTTLGLALMGLLPQSTQVYGHVWFHGTDLLSLPPQAMHTYRGRHIALIPQEPLQALNPVLPVGIQIVEVLRAHRGLSRDAAWREAQHLLGQVAVPNPDLRLRAYPHELSGGLRQRVLIAMALAGDPQLIIADEPTTALDVTIQAQILALVRNLRETLGVSFLWITHDMGVVAEIADRVGVMYAGRLVEWAPVTDLFRKPQHPYTQALLAVIPGQQSPGTPLPTIPGSVPDLTQPPGGCPFAPRCPEVRSRCYAEFPPEVRQETHRVACWLCVDEETSGRS